MKKGMPLAAVYHATYLKIPTVHIYTFEQNIKADFRFKINDVVLLLFIILLQKESHIL